MRTYVRDEPGRGVCAVQAGARSRQLHAGLDAGFRGPEGLAGGRTRATPTGAGCRAGALRPWCSPLARAALYREAAIDGRGTTRAGRSRRSARAGGLDDGSGARRSLRGSRSRPGGTASRRVAIRSTRLRRPLSVSASRSANQQWGLSSSVLAGRPVRAGPVGAVHGGPVEPLGSKSKPGSRIEARITAAPG